MSEQEGRIAERVPDEKIMNFVYERACELDGVYGMRKKSRSVRVTYDEENRYTIDIYMTATFGTNIPETAWNVQKSVHEGLKDEYGIEPEDINIHIQGVNAG